jgi:hypothetical protein
VKIKPGKDEKPVRAIGSFGSLARTPDPKANASAWDRNLGTHGTAVIFGATMAIVKKGYSEF